MSINENLEKLSNANGVTGRENQVRDLMIQLLKPLRRRNPSWIN